ncbi:type VI secretion system baseplate subunit TssE [Aidingimonas halophila]|uniref:Type VI secretion system protein n=1 Tax=Aidingimonas halophila TaxID=574349 RepID=A0A1H2ZJ74_9GAMM|nr:type VI secretion system baseplate subunit TssE [Aidingimonas halophila]GHC16175.1 lysozyme [Aidingimonas halophila]SDX17466.1 type VI secretion system protein [Aidingimonas halophila]
MRHHRDGVPGGRLFERLATPTAFRNDGNRHDLAVMVDSIKRHLVELLNSRPGHSESAPSLGLVDFNDATIGVLDLERRIQRDIRECIERFEPRVEYVRVETMPHGGEPLELHFQVHAVLDLGQGQARTTIDLLLNNKRYHCLN